MCPPDRPGVRGGCVCATLDLPLSLFDAGGESSGDEVGDALGYLFLDNAFRGTVAGTGLLHTDIRVTDVRLIPEPVVPAMLAVGGLAAVTRRRRG